MSVKRLRTVVIGFGRVASGYAKDPVMARHYPYATHAQVLAAHPGFSWDAVVDTDGEALAAARAEWKIPITVRTVSGLPAGYAPEIAVLATPPRSRLDIIEKLPTLRGVLVEKPLGLTLQDSRAFLERCRKGGILVQVNYWRRADKVFRGLAAGRLETLIGRPQAVFGLYGNGLLNNGSHMIDFARMLFGEIETVDADRVTEISFTSAIADDIHTSFRLKMATGLVVSFQPLDFKHYRENGLDVWGEKGRLSIVQEGLALSLFPRGENRAMSGEREIASDHPQALETSVGSAFYEMYGNLADAVHGKEPLWSPGESAMSTARAVQAVFESEKSGQRIVSVE